MTDTQTRGMDIAPDVLDTIVALALKDVEGVAVVGQTSTGIFPSSAPNRIRRACV